MTADVLYLDALRFKSGIPAPRREAFLPPVGKREGDPVTLPSGERGMVVGAAPRAVFGKGSTVMLAVQGAGKITVLPADDVTAAGAAPVQAPCDVEG